MGHFFARQIAAVPTRVINWAAALGIVFLIGYGLGAAEHGWWFCR